jgi:hypothetical protein
MTKNVSTPQLRKKNREHPNRKNVSTSQVKEGECIVTEAMCKRLPIERM